MDYKLIDSHAHLTSSPLRENIDAVLARAKAVGIESIVNICIDADGIQLGLSYKERYPWIYNAGAVHPHDAEKDGEQLFPIVAQHARAKNFVAIGETGLDYFYQHSSQEIQQQVLRKHLHLALECKLPVIIHCREAYADFFSILDTEYKHGPGVLHCFTGTLDEAKQGLERDLYISLSGIVTFKKSAELREVAKLVPMNRLLIETDAPFLAPQSHRGKPNEPSFIVETALVIAAVKGVSLAELAQATSANANRLFGLV